MRSIATVLLMLFWSAWASAQAIPTVAQWIGIFQEVHRHPLFADLKISYAKAPAENVGYSPVGVIPREGLDCVVVVSEGANPKMERMMRLTHSPYSTRVFLLAIAAHEFGHCFRIRSKNLSAQLWINVMAAAPGSPERQALERRVSIEEAYADFRKVLDGNVPAIHLRNRLSSAHNRRLVAGSCVVRGNGCRS